jgi:hypothetical protein
MTTKAPEEKEPLAYSINELAAVSSFSRTEINRALAGGELIAKKRGTRRFILVDEAKRWLKSHPDA